jgi:hypothetical protein
MKRIPDPTGGEDPEIREEIEGGRVQVLAGVEVGINRGSFLSISLTIGKG